MSLATGVSETVGYLTFGDTQKGAGTYSATPGLGVDFVDGERFAGSGALTVLHGNRGTIIRMR